MASNIGLRKKLTSLVALVACLVAGATAVRAQRVCVAQGQTKTFTYKQSMTAPGVATATFKLENDVLTVDYKNTTLTAFLTGVAFDVAPEVSLESDSAATASNGWQAGSSSGGGLGGFDFIAYGNGSKLRLAPGMGGKASYTLDYARTEVCITKTVAHLTGLFGSTSKPVGVLTGSGTTDNGGLPIYVD